MLRWLATSRLLGNQLLPGLRAPLHQRSFLDFRSL
jgi:hypothetical protein